jgi:hypothetical protein
VRAPSATASSAGRATGQTHIDARAAGLPTVWVALAFAGLGVAVWLLVDPRTPDLAAQVYRANLFREVGPLVWDSRWYGGHDIPGYSLLFGPLAALLGVRTVGALAVLASTALFAALAARLFGARAARWGAAWFALAALGDVWSGRVTFALGVSFGLAALAAFVLPARRPPATALAATLAALCAAASPVAGALLALAALTRSLSIRSPRTLLVLGAPPVLVIALLALAFPEGGWEPYPFLSLLATLAALAGFLAALPPGPHRRLLRFGALLYLAVCLACVLVHTPLGGNVERYGILFGGPLLVCALLQSARRPGVFTAAALLGLALWTAWGPVRETVAVAGDPSTSAAYYAPVVRFLDAHGGARLRVEVPFTRAHWESAYLASHFMLARGWEKQLDERHDAILLSKHLTAAAYRHWLLANAVAYIALPDVPLDPSSAAEGRVLAARPSYLREVLHTRHWRIFAVRDPTPLVSGPGTLAAVGHDSFLLHASAPGRFLVRLHYTSYWTVTAGSACVSAARDDWTAVSVRARGLVRVAARFSLGSALGLGGSSCS